METTDLFFNNFKTAPDDPQFLNAVFTSVTKKLKTSRKNDIISEELDVLSQRVDRSSFQESCLIRATIRARQLAELLITDDGELDLERVLKSIDQLKKHCYSLGQNRQYDSARQKHLLNSLETLFQDKDLQKLLKTITRPYSHKIADQVLRETLYLDANQSLSDATARRAVLSAWFCYLRQNVGSCFATAPAIIVQNEQAHLFFQDMKELLDTGRIKRTFGGNEYVVPLSSSSGIGEFKKQILLFASDKKKLDDLGYSPGLLEALETVGLIDPRISLKQRVDQVRQLIKDSLEPSLVNKTYLFLSAEELLKSILMRSLEITEKDLKDYASRPKALMHTSLLMAAPNRPSKIRGKNDACAAFYHQMNLAKTAFNSLMENPLLKIWEFSIASFAETKPGFTRWNMYASLGFNADQPGGIADCLYQEIKFRLDQSNAKVRGFQDEYEMIYGQLKFIEGRMRNATTEKEAQWGKIEYESKRGEFRVIEELRDRENFKAGRFANLINDLLDKYDALFPRYFQEVYDPDMHEVATGPYDDSPAGFRLLYKHGRENTSQWTLIYSPQEFIEALSSFFVMTEPEIVNASDMQGLEDELSQIITRLVTHVKTDEFLISAFHRMAEAHHAPIIKDPLEHLEIIDKKPWAYISGGTMDNLISCYFRLEEKPKSIERWVENELELLVFFIDTIKQMPHSILDKYLASKELSLLIHSPTHAFTFRPGFPLIKKAVLAEEFTYTWIRDNLVRPQEHFIEFMFLDQEMMTFLLNKLIDLVPSSLRLRFQSITSNYHGRKNPPEFRRFIAEAMDNDPIINMHGGGLSLDDLDSALFNWLPLTSRYELKNRAEKILENLPGLTPAHHEEISIHLDSLIQKWGDSAFITAEQLQNICKALLCIALEQTSTEFNYPELITSAAQKLGYALGPPILFGDTNWVKDLFAFVVNPGRAELELWRVDPLGQIGAPMSAWKKWLDGSDRSRTWGIYTKPQEYRA